MLIQTITISENNKHLKEMAYLALRCIANGEVIENGAPNATVSTYLFHRVHCHQLLHTSLCRSLGRPHAFYVSFLQYLRWSTDVSYLSYRLLFLDKPYLLFLHHPSIRTFFYILTVKSMIDLFLVNQYS